MNAIDYHRGQYMSQLLSLQMAIHHDGTHINLGFEGISNQKVK